MPQYNIRTNQYTERNNDLFDVVLQANENGIIRDPRYNEISDFSNRTAFTSVFGELVTGVRQNNINVPFIRSTGLDGNIDYLKNVRSIQSGTTSAVFENETAYIQTGLGLGSFEFISVATNRYITGHSNEVFHTMVFSEPESNVQSGIGYGRKDSDFIGFGYNGTVFGIWLILRGVKTHIPQENWNENTLLEGDFILNPQKENISGTSFGWLGVADILFYINTSEKGWILVHRHKTANIDSKPHLTDPNQPISSFIERTTGNGNNIRIGTSSWAAGTIGERAKGTGSDKTPFIEISGKSIPANTETILLSIKNNPTFKGKPNTVRVRYGTLTLTTDGTKSVSFRVYVNGVSGGVFTDYDTDLSVSSISTDTTLSYTTTTIAGIPRRNEQVGGTYLGKTDRERLNLFESDIIIAAYPGDIITITAFSTGATVVDMELRWIEEF
jgi:hypothetical protein